MARVDVIEVARRGETGPVGPQGTPGVGAGGMGVPTDGTSPEELAWVAGAPTWREKPAFDVRDFGAVGDGTTNDAAAIVATHAAIEAAGGGTMLFGGQGKTYRMSTAITMVSTVPLIIDLNGQTIAKDHALLWKIRSEIITPARTLSVAITRGAKTLTLTSAATVQKGDILYLDENVVTETTWNTPRRACLSVRSVAGNVVTVTSTIKMPFSTSATITHYRPKPFSLRNGTLHYATTPTDQFGNTLLWLEGFSAPRVDNITGSSDQTWVSGGPLGVAILQLACVNAEYSNIHVAGISYGIEALSSLNTIVSSMTGENIRHPVVPTAWSDGFRVQGLTTNNTWSTVDSHPAFNVAYENVVGHRDETLSNLRCIGGSLTNATIYNDATDADAGPFFHYLLLSDPTWFDDARLVLDNVNIIAPALVNKRTIGAFYGHGVFNNVVAPMGNDVDAPSFTNTVKSITITNCRNQNGTPWRRKVFRFATRVTENPYLPAVLDTGVYHIDPWSTLMDSKNGIMKCYGRILEGNTTDPQAISIAIHDNVFPEQDTANDFTLRVLGVLKLRASVLHGNAGLFDILTKTYHFYHKVFATSSVEFPLTAAITDGLTGQANESLAMTLSNVTQQGSTQLGVGYINTLVQFDVAISSGRTAPRYSLSYELELTRG